jgi:hypothetical protein
MKQRVVAAVAFLGIAVGFAQADYAVIRVNLAQVGAAKPDDKTPPPEVKAGDASQIAVGFVEFARATERPDWAAALDLKDKDDRFLWMSHRWGRSAFLSDKTAFQIYILSQDTSILEKDRRYLPTVRARHETEVRILHNNKNSTPEQYRKAIEWAIGNGLDAIQADKPSSKAGDTENRSLLSEVLKKDGLMDEFLKMDPKGDAKVTAAQKACAAARKHLDSPLTEDDPAIVWKTKDRLDCKLRHENHYTLLYNGGTLADVARRSRRLEENYRHYFYWFAIRGYELPLPTQRQVALLVFDKGAFTDMQASFEGVALVRLRENPYGRRPSFYARRENLAVFSAQRLDFAYESLEAISRERQTQGWDFRKLAQGTGGTPANWNKAGGDPKEAYKELFNNQTLALLYRALMDEGELASVTHESTRQLLTASGILPRNVIVPDWVQFGLPAAFESPMYEVYSQAGAFWPTFGEPNWVYLTYYKLWEKEKAHWLQSPDKALEAILTDQYFSQARLKSDERDPLADDYLIRARTMSWALSHYLVHRRIDDLIAYGKEMDKLPRDLELDEKAKLMCFARAFKLTRKDNPNELDSKAWADFVTAWHDFMGTQALAVPSALDLSKKSLQERRPSLLAQRLAAP